MWQEYALDPSILNSWDRFRLFFEQCGLDKGRLISRYPKRWEKAYLESLADTAIGRARIVEKLKQFGATKFCSHPNTFPIPCQDWLVAAESEDTTHPFYAIVSESNPRGHIKVLQFEDIEEAHALWRTETPWHIPRQADRMADCARHLLLKANELLFIDPYFDPNVSRFQRPMMTWLKTIEHRLQQVVRLEIHTSWNAGRNNNNPASWARSLEDDAQRRCLRYLPQNTSIRYYVWKSREEGQNFHARYLLTDHGGLGFEHGLDDGSEHETCDVYLIGQEAKQKIWTQYQEHTSAFDLVHTFTIRS